MKRDVDRLLLGFFKMQLKFKLIMIMIVLFGVDLVMSIDH